MNPIYLLGSGKPHGQSTSEALARYLHRRLGLMVDRLPAFQAFDAKTLLHAQHELRFTQALASADLLVLACPVYIDALPYPVVRAFERLASHPLAKENSCRLVAIVNSGFPEAAQSRTALDIARIFARQAGFSWAGGLALGGGEALQGRPLEAAGGAARYARSALTLAAAALARGQPVPARATELMAKPFVPRFLYRLLGEWGWRKRARRQGSPNLNARPFAERTPESTTAAR